jgi:hypothetical protein
MSGTQTRASTDSFELGSPELGSIGALAFSPDSVLFVADNARAQILALDLSSDEHETPIREIEHLDRRLAAFLGCGSLDFVIRDFVVHPTSGAAYLSVTRGHGNEAIPVLIRVTGDGTLSEVELDRIRYARTGIDDAPAPDDPRQSGQTLRDDDAAGDPLFITETFALQVERGPLRTNTVTDLEFVDGELLVAGASNEEFSSALRRIPFPFRRESQGSSLEIFHVSHGMWETRSPIRTLAAYAGGSAVLASYTCTPLVHFPLVDLIGGTRVTGRTVAELGSGSSPIDIAPFTRDGDEYVLVSNSRLGLFRIDCRDIDAQQGLTEPREPIGVPRKHLPHKGVGHMAAVGDQVLMLQHEGSRVDLRSYDSASL